MVPLGVTIYDVIIKMIYRKGYYLENQMNQLALTVQKTIGSKWIRNKDLVLQVVQYCADIGLFDKDLSLQSVLTSAGIQKRYSLATVRSKAQIVKYRLIEKESDKSLLSAPLKGISATEKGISATEIQNNGAEMPLKESKGNSIYNTTFSPELERAFQMYLLVRRNNFGEMPEEQIQALREDLITLSDKEQDRLAIVKKATASGWKSFYPLKRSQDNKGSQVQSTKKKNSFGNFHQREYDYAALEASLLGGQETKNE